MTLVGKAFGKIAFIRNNIWHIDIKQNDIFSLDQVAMTNNNQYPNLLQ